MLESVLVPIDLESKLPQRGCRVGDRAELTDDRKVANDRCQP